VASAALFSEAEAWTNYAEALRLRVAGSHSGAARGAALHGAAQCTPLRAAAVRDAVAAAAPAAAAAERGSGHGAARHGESGAQRVAHALEALERAIALLPSFAPAHAARGSMLLHRGETRAALESLARAAALQPHVGKHHAHVGVVLMQLASRALEEAAAAAVGAQRSGAQRSGAQCAANESAPALLARAAERFALASRLDPTDARSALNLAKARWVNARLGAALAGHGVAARGPTRSSHSRRAGLA